MISQCAGCSKFIQGTSKDPIITGKLLGWKNYHDACAKHEWARLASPASRGARGTRLISLSPSSSKEVEVAKPAKKTQFHVQCVLMTNGKEESRWHNILDTLDEAEYYCVKQMGLSEFDQAWLAPPLSAGQAAAGSSNEVEDAKPICNASPLKYVNCTVSMMMTNGKNTVIDERVHPMALEAEDAAARASAK